MSWDTPKRGLGVPDSGSGARCCPAGTRGGHPVHKEPPLSPPPSESGRSLVKCPGRGRCWGAGVLACSCRENVGGPAQLGLHGGPGPACRAVLCALHPESPARPLHPAGGLQKSQVTGAQCLGDPCSQPEGKGEAGRASGGEWGVFCPVPNAFVMTPALTHTFPVSLIRWAGKPCFQYNHILTKQSGLVPNWQPN